MNQIILMCIIFLWQKFLYDSYEETGDYGQNYLTDSDFQTIGKTFDSIYKAETAILGPNTFTGGIYSDYLRRFDDKVIIVVCDINFDGSESQKSGTFGFFSQVDFYTGSQYSYASNQNEIIYIDSVFYKKSQKQTLSTLTHEFCHLLNYVNKEVKNDLEMQEWFTEMLAMNTEEIMYSNYVDKGCGNSDKVLNVRIPDFCKGSKYGFTRWSGGANVYEEYGNTFAYGAFLLRNYGGVNLIHEIATNGEVNKEAVEKALKSCGYNVSFEDTVKEFALSSVNSVVSSKYSDDIKSLYKVVTGNIGGYSFHGYKIDLSKYGGIQTLSNKRVTEVESTGFIVQYAGKGKNKLEVTLPGDSNLKMYCVVRTVE